MDPRWQCSESDRVAQSRHEVGCLEVGRRQLGRRELTRLWKEADARAAGVGGRPAPIDPTTLVNEVARRMLGAAGAQDLPCRSDFFADLALALRGLLRRHGPARSHAWLDLGAIGAGRATRPAALDAVLRRLEDASPRHAQIAALRLLGGLTTAEIALQTGLTRQRAAIGWVTARDWMRSWLAAAPRAVGGSDAKRGPAASLGDTARTLRIFPAPREQPPATSARWP
ncbi:MAG: ECF-type sigma factor [Planctomycetota bacterium]